MTLGTDETLPPDPEQTPGQLDATMAADADATGASSPPASPMDRGSIIGRYVVLSRLGAGAMGVVLAAYDPELDRKVALKLLRPRGGEQSAARTRLQREAQALAKLNHPNVVAVHDVGLHGARVFVAMEHVSGQTIGDWIESGAQPVKEVLRVFGEAGRGLAAAHAAGLVHRDFKPDNVMLDDSGGVRVMDFGLARSGDDEEGEPPNLEPDAVVAARTRDPLATPLTRTGAIMGTPAYMAPEQFAGAVVDARSDQFGFCVSLYEALYGERPFAGASLVELSVSVTEGEIRDAPSKTSVPGWVRAALLRGLSVKPEDRWPSMEALVVVLGHGAARSRRNRIFASLGALGLCAGAVMGYQQWDEARRIDACVADGNRVEAVWNAASRASLRDGLLATGVSYAHSTVDKVMPFFEAQAEAIRSAQTQACLETRVQGAWSEDLLTRATWCLDERRMQIEAVADELSGADDKSMQKAITAAAKLSAVAPCRDEQRLRQSPSPPEDRQAVEAVLRTLSTAEAREFAGKYDEALEVAKGALVEAEAIGWPALSASARWRVGTLLDSTGEYEAAETTLETAYFEAAGVGATDVMVETAADLTYTVGFKLARHEDGHRWARHAQLALATLREPEESLRRAELNNNIAAIHDVAAEYEQALQLYERALAVREKILGPQHPSVATSLNNLASLHKDMAAFDQAKSLFHEAVAIKEKALGPEHPSVGLSLYNLGRVHLNAGEYDEAKAILERALSIMEKSLGKDHSNVGAALNGLGQIHRANREYEEAKASYERSLAIWEKTFGPEHPNIATSLNNLAVVYDATGEASEAKALYERALAITEKAVGPEHPNVATSLNNIGMAYAASGDYDEANARYERAVAIYEKALGPDHVRLSYPLDGLAEVALDRGRPRDAIAYVERALALRTSTETAAVMIAKSRFLLARALWDAPAGSGRDRGRALDLAEQSRDAYEVASNRAERLAKVEAWLADHQL
jgi:tetratricopeptide (TPR) repeat protein